MLNQIVIVGRLVRDPELRETDGGKKVTNITLAVPRSYKNVNGEYETDYIDCVLWTGNQLSGKGNGGEAGVALCDFGAFDTDASVYAAVFTASGVLLGAQG